LARHLAQLVTRRGLPRITRSGGGQDVVGKAMLNCAHERHANSWQIDSGKPNQNAEIQSFSGRLRDERRTEHWFTSPDYARGVTEAWRREYNDERSKRVLGGSTPSEYAKKIQSKVVSLTVSLKTQPELNPGAGRASGACYRNGSMLGPALLAYIGVYSQQCNELLVD
jgi:putative transposase